MPVHIGWRGRLLAQKLYIQDKFKKSYKTEADPSKRKQGYIFGETDEMVLKYSQQLRQCIVATYEMYRETVERWNPGRPSWKVSGAPVEYGRRARIGTHRGGQARQGLAAFEGGHEIFTNKSFDKIKVQPVSAEEWTNCLARDCPLDEQIKRVFEARPGIQLILIRGGDVWARANSKSAEEMMKLKRIEMGDGSHWEIVWSNCEK